jgi:hypothetical protein
LDHAIKRLRSSLKSRAVTEIGKEKEIMGPYLPKSNYIDD